ncbi:tetratricopeptide repeat protein 25-like [Aplysia californica]|uniref:Outer dynein arm-docking complex subunit 4 n=1 Tax=Aplysia californica TaxID=6500 RepID=A0ABM1W008_APLCA|nr:tetratricopeptide repeat protein 25-like [Aplysia californica]
MIIICIKFSNLHLVPQAVYQKAEIHYRQGHYEMALMTFNRGHKLNPSAPGFSEGVQKAQHALDIMTAGRSMKTTVVGDLSLFLPKKNANVQGTKRNLPQLTSRSDDLRVPSPGFRKRHGTLLLQVQKRPHPVMGQPDYGNSDRMHGVSLVDDKAMKEILGQLYDDKEYFERILRKAGLYRIFPMLFKRL